MRDPDGDRLQDRTQELDAEAHGLVVGSRLGKLGWGYSAKSLLVFTKNLLKLAKIG